MLITKFKILRSNNNKNINFELKSNYNISDNTNSYPILLFSETESNINESVDVEKIMYSNLIRFTLHTTFINSIGETGNTYQYAGFENIDLTKLSFDYIDIYDSINNNTAQKLDTIYIYPTDSSTTNVIIQARNIEANMYLANNFIDKNEDIFTVYGRLFFFNAKTGNIHIFNNFDNLTDINENRLYFPITITKTTYSYSTFSNDISFIENKNSQYVNKYNSNIDKNFNKELFISSKTIFKTDGTYI